MLLLYTLIDSLEILQNSIWSYTSNNILIFWTNYITIALKILKNPQKELFAKHSIILKNSKSINIWLLKKRLVFIIKYVKYLVRYTKVL